MSALGRLRDNRTPHSSQIEPDAENEQNEAHFCVTKGCWWFCGFCVDLQPRLPNPCVRWTSSLAQWTAAKKEATAATKSVTVSAAKSAKVAIDLAKQCAADEARETDRLDEWALRGRSMGRALAPVTGEGGHDIHAPLGRDQAGGRQRSCGAVLVQPLGRLREVHRDLSTPRTLEWSGTGRPQGMHVGGGSARGGAKSGGVKSGGQLVLQERICFLSMTLLQPTQ